MFADANARRDLEAIVPGGVSRDYCGPSSVRTPGRLAAAVVDIPQRESGHAQDFDRVVVTRRRSRSASAVAHTRLTDTQARRRLAAQQRQTRKSRADFVITRRPGRDTDRQVDEILQALLSRKTIVAETVRAGSEG